MRGVRLALLVLCTVGSSAEGMVLCARRSGVVVLRQSCKRKETRLPISIEDGGATVQFTGVNVQIVSGGGTTDASPNGRGNVIIGYDANTGNHDRSGSHNLVIGDEHTYSSYGGLVAGSTNAITGPSACVTGGNGNTASGFHASVSGGAGNIASGTTSSVSGGMKNIASDESASVSGGAGNHAAANAAWAAGGQNNSAMAFGAAVGGGVQNTASGDGSSVSGGMNVSVASPNGWAAGGLHSP